ncbi:hypothetical protein NLJ89_g11470 [Agrocybe chaxingu]|uniref:Nucleoporin Nup159/Nup146 N-terminal domain-containing protein n=1 Tax=Agrocybe chaxingu TaxID=84603 RepID=A0A9W8MR53_9AGAR|nr:hypothetical protein NLJ89_g11470 [Agrocybe chaxingu]
MNEFTPLSRPQQSQVTIDSIAKDCPSEGFNYPTFRQLNKQARVYLSQPFTLNPSVSYHLFAVSNSKGWFSAVQSTPSGSALIFSPLEDLRSAFSAAKEDVEDLFSPKRTLSIQAGNVNIIDFACNDTRLIVGLENGSLGMYDTASLFTPGTEQIQPLRTVQVQTSPLRQIAPNPGTEANLSELFAVVGDGKVQLLNMQLEPQGGWEGTDLMSQPISVAWSPKGKHIAIGLQTGDILTFSLTNKSTPHKHIPPTSDAILVSLNWLGPGHTFRTSYGAQGDIAAKQHIIVLDTKSSTAIYFAPDHPYPSYDRTQQNAFVLTLHKWDEDAASQADSKSLTVVGDVSSVDLEVLGNVGNNWHRHSQENQLSLPLDKSMDDTILLALEADLTDSSTNAPIMYAYLNDGSLQGWHAEHPSSKPYLGMITLGVSSSTATPATQAFKDADMGAETPPTSAFAQPAPATSAFGQPSFGQTSSPFGQTGGGSTFGQSSFGQAQKATAFGQSSFVQPSTTSAFGSFGQANQTNNTASAFGAVKPAVGFGAFGGSTGAFGSGSSVGFGSAATPSAFSSFASNTTSNVFGQGSFGAPATASSPPESADPTSMTREASMSDSTSGFGSMGLGSATPSDPNAVNSMFGSIQPSSSSNQTQSTSAFGGGLVKPASGFGAFGSFGSGGAFDPSNKPAPTVSAFSAAAQPAPTATTTMSSGFGQSGRA